MNKETLFNKILTQLCTLFFPESFSCFNHKIKQEKTTTWATNLMWKHHFKGNSHLLKRWSFIFPTAPRRATSVFLTFRVSHCIKLPGSPDRCHGGKMDHPIFDGRKTTCKCYWFWNFLFLMSKVPIKMGILMVSKIKFGEIWDFLCYECYLSLAEDTRFRTKLYVIVCIYIYIHIGSAPYPGCQTMLQLHCIFRIGKPYNSCDCYWVGRTSNIWYTIYIYTIISN